jgi:hypothetical protein
VDTDRLDKEEQAMLNLTAEMRALVGLPCNASCEEFGAALNRLWPSMTTEKMERIAFLALEAARIGRRLMSRIKPLIPEAAELKEKFSVQVSMLANAIADDPDTSRLK